MLRCPVSVLHLEPGAWGGQIASNGQYNVRDVERKFLNRLERQAIGNTFQCAEIHAGIGLRNEPCGKSQAPVIHRDEVAVGAVEPLWPGDRGWGA
eukprot:1932798-Pyramimonas_sp.AAC.1